VLIGVLAARGTSTSPEFVATNLAHLRGLFNGRSPRSLGTSDRSVGRLCSRFERHPLAGFRTPSTHLDALLEQLIVSCYLQAILTALFTELSTKAADSIVKRRLPQHVIDRSRAHLRTIHQDTDAIGGRVAPAQFQTMCDGFRAHRMAVSTELDARSHLIVRMMPSLHWQSVRIRPAS
jgi:hypothetical protein